MGIDEPFSLIAVKGKRVSKVHQMKEKMVAISRLCITDYWCDQMVDSTEVAHQDFYRPQVNDVRLRTEMLHTGLMDAAILPEPYAAYLKKAGHKELKRTPADAPRLGVWVMQPSHKEDSYKQEQISLFRMVYDKAVERLNAGEKADSLTVILLKEYGLSPQAQDSLALPRLNCSFAPTKEEVSTAAKWLRGRHRMPRNVLPDSLLWEIPGSKDKQ